MDLHERSYTLAIMIPYALSFVHDEATQKITSLMPLSVQTI